MVVAFLCMGGKRFNVKCIEPLFHYTEGKIDMLKFQREVFMPIPASFGGNKTGKSLAFPQNVANNAKLDTKNHVLVKGTSQCCCCKHCGGKSIYLWQKYNVALHPDFFKDYH